MKARRASPTRSARPTGGIGYVEYSYAVKAGLPTADDRQRRRAGRSCPRTRASAAVGTAKVVGTGNDLSLSIDYAQKTPGAYPIVLVTYEIVCTKYKDAAVGTFVKNFLDLHRLEPARQRCPARLRADPGRSCNAKVKASIAKIS